MPFKSYREESRKNFGTETTGLSLDQINTGCMQRIADSVEVIAKDRVQMEKDLKFYKQQSEKLYEENQSLISSRAAYKGKLNNAKNRIADLEMKVGELTNSNNRDGE